MLRKEPAADSVPPQGPAGEDQGIRAPNLPLVLLIFQHLPGFCINGQRAEARTSSVHVKHEDVCVPRRTPFWVMIDGEEARPWVPSGRPP